MIGEKVLQNISHEERHDELNKTCFCTPSFGLLKKFVSCQDYTRHYESGIVLLKAKVPRIYVNLRYYSIYTLITFLKKHVTLSTNMPTVPF